MTPGLGFFYSGLARAKGALSNVMICMLAYCIVTIQWVLYGFSLTFSESATNGFIGNFDMGGFVNVGVNSLPITAPQIPSIAFALYQLQFATITAGIIFGSVSERFRMIPGIYRSRAHLSNNC
jgi:Amt family ammonium transporter